MEKLYIEGGFPLRGTVEIGGSKNAALPLLFAGILTGDVCTISRLPRVSDVLKTLEILRFLGAHIHFSENGDVRIDYRDVRAVLPPPYLTSPIRGSVYVLGALLGRFGQAEFGGSGGCDFGKRPIDQHLMGFSRLGAKEDWVGECLTLTAPALVGAEISLKMPSVGATANLMMAATAAKGNTVIENAAAEPHVSALADFLMKAGANIKGVGTSRIEIMGGAPLHGCHVTVIPDMIEAGTYLAMGMATGGRVTVRHIDPNDLECVFDTLTAMGATMHVGSDFATLIAPRSYRSVFIKTGPYPQFPTDLHPQFATLLALPCAMGSAFVRETVFASRFAYVGELQKMGADIKIKEECVFITPAALTPATLRSPDLRGGAALLIAALATKGKTVLENAKTLSRGYEHLAKKLSLLGAEIEEE